tara:strand:+ start:5375 stop:6145 length:771 start_codon:yes stop_codon:yes gene_type:complete
MKFTEKEKKHIYKQIDENGYYKLDNIFSNSQIENVKDSLFSILSYIKPDGNIKDLQEKYYQIKDYSMKLKGHFFDMTSFDINTLQILFDEKIIDLVKGYFKTEVIFSGRPSVHIHDSENERFLDPHQETNQCAKDFLFIWAPLYDAKGDQGGLNLYEKSHKYGYWKHHNTNKLGSSHLKDDVLKKFKKRKMEVDAGSALLIHSALIHGSVETKKHRFARFILCDRYCPLQKIPYLKKEEAPLKIPHFGTDYNLITE